MDAREASLWFGNLPYEASEESLLNFIALLGGDVQSISMQVDEISGRNRGSAFVRFSDYDNMVLLRETLNGIYFQGRSLIVDWATTRHRPTSPAATEHTQGHTQTHTGGGKGDLRESEWMSLTPVVRASLSQIGFIVRPTTPIQTSTTTQPPPPSPPPSASEGVALPSATLPSATLTETTLTETQPPLPALSIETQKRIASLQMAELAAAVEVVHRAASERPKEMKTLTKLDGKKWNDYVACRRLLESSQRSS